MNRIDVYKQIAGLLGNKTFAVPELETLSTILNYLAQEISANEPTETTDDHGPQG